MEPKFSCIHATRAVLLKKGGGVAPGMPTSEQQEVSAPSWGDLPPLLSRLSRCATPPDHFRTKGEECCLCLVCGTVPEMK